MPKRTYPRYIGTALIMNLTMRGKASLVVDEVSAAYGKEAGILQGQDEHEEILIIFQIFQQICCYTHGTY